MTQKQTRGKLRPLLSGVILRAQTDERLGALAGAGNQPAFGTLFERYGRELRVHAGRIVRSDRADDVVQQAMLGAWVALVEGTRVVDVRPWLHRVVHNAALDTVARRGYDDGELPSTLVASALTDERAENRLNAQAALAALAALPEGQRRALTLTAIEGRSGRDAALAMGVSEGAMRQLVHRARTGMRAAATGITPMPLFEFLGGSGAPAATPAIVGLGAAGGGAAIAKVAAVVGASAVTLGAAHALQPHHGASHARRAAVVQTQTSTRGPESGATAAAVRRASFGAQPVGGTRSTVGRRSAIRVWRSQLAASFENRAGGGQSGPHEASVSGQFGPHEASASGIDAGGGPDQSGRQKNPAGADNTATLHTNAAQSQQTDAHASSAPAPEAASKDQQSPPPKSAEPASGF